MQVETELKRALHTRTHIDTRLPHDTPPTPQVEELQQALTHLGSEKGRNGEHGQGGDVQGMVVLRRELAACQEKLAEERSARITLEEQVCVFGLLRVG